MTYLYHRVPKNLQGNILFPLNILKEKFPDIYQRELGKYSGREELLRIQLPLLRCLWNDVLHLTSVHPFEIKQALKEAGREGEFVMEYFEIDPKSLNPDEAIIYRYLQEDNADIVREDNFIFFDLGEIESLSKMPQVTKDYYQNCIAQGKKPLLYHRIPHIPYRGAINISHARRIVV